MSGKQPGRPSGKMDRMAEWLDARLLPTLGPPPTGPYDEEPEMKSSEAPCPLCTHPMGEHEFDRSHANAVLICPVTPNPEVLSFAPLNEVGMTKRIPESPTDK